MFIAIGPRLNRRVMDAFRVYKNELINADDQTANRVPFQAFTLERFIDALAEAGANGIARDLWGRYVDFERVYHVSLSEYLEKPSDLVTTAPLAVPSSSDVKASLKKARTRTTAKRATKRKSQKVQRVPLRHPPDSG
jgi:hypothetical protein